MKPVGLYMINDSDATYLTLADRVKLFAETGFDYICFSASQALETDALQLAEKNGLPVDNVHLSGAGTNDLWHEGLAGDSIVERYCSEIAAISQRGIHLGVAHVTWGKESVPCNALGLQRIARIIDCAEKNGFVIGFENSVSPDLHLRAVLDAFRSPAAGFTFDTGHWHCFAPESTFPFEYAERLVITHIQDNDGSEDQHRVPFDGTVNYASLVPILCHASRLTFEPARRAKNPELYGMMSYEKHLSYIHDAALRIAELIT
ncbi:MAG: TIM barrel protein [Clostridia bacterium]|nr:TIM barrel protein [Clostridia bacterium]